MLGWTQQTSNKPVKLICTAAKHKVQLHPNKNHAGHLPLHSRNIHKAKLLKHRRPVSHDGSDGWLCPKKSGLLKTKSYCMQQCHKQTSQMQSVQIPSKKQTLNVILINPLIRAISIRFLASAPEVNICMKLITIWTKRQQHACSNLALVLISTCNMKFRTVSM